MGKREDTPCYDSICGARCSPAHLEPHPQQAEPPQGTKVPGLHLEDLMTAPDKIRPKSVGELSIRQFFYQFLGQPIISDVAGDVGVKKLTIKTQANSGQLSNNFPTIRPAFQSLHSVCDPTPPHTTEGMSIELRPPGGGD